MPRPGSPLRLGLTLRLTLVLLVTAAVGVGALALLPTRLGEAPEAVTAGAALAGALILVVGLLVWRWVTRPVAEMLDWFIRHHPESAHHYIGEIMREAHRRWEIPAEETIRTLRTAVSMDGKMSDEDRKAFFALLAPPTTT